MAKIHIMPCIEKNMVALGIYPSDESERKKLERLLESGKLPDEPIPASLIHTKIIVFNPIYGSLLYGFKRFFGTPVGIRKPKSHIFSVPLELTPYEALYLMKKGIIKIFDEIDEKELDMDAFIRKMESQVKDFIYKYYIYEDLRDKKYVPRPGQKFGADFIVYEEGPGLGHSSFCVLVKPRENAKITALDVVTAGRLANSVRKTFVLANSITRTYYKFKWIKP